jgi:hypothetical protein
MKRPVFQDISGCFGIFQDNLTGGGWRNAERGVRSVELLQEQTKITMKRIEEED